MNLTQPLDNGKFYHIYNRGINSDKLFTETSDYDYFLKLYERHIDPVADTYAWCLMKNHFHFLVRIKDIEEIKMEKIIPPSQSFSNLFNAYSKTYNKIYQRHGPLFERPFKRKEIDSESYLRNVIVYIHRNPVHHGICDDPLEYPWSSFSSCISDKKTKFQRNEVIALFEDLDNFKYNHLRLSDDFSSELLRW